MRCPRLSSLRHSWPVITVNLWGVCIRSVRPHSTEAFAAIPYSIRADGDSLSESSFHCLFIPGMKRLLVVGAVT
jgi:hypothetical protein